MQGNQETRTKKRTIGIECGGTRTTAVLIGEENDVLRRGTFSAGNLQMLDDRALVALFAEIRQELGSAADVGVGMAGLRTARDRQRMKKIVAPFWPDARFYLGDDLETVFAGVPVEEPEKVTRVLLLAGTGSCCLAVSPNGDRLKVGGWGHQLGDETGAYGIALAALSQLVDQYDRTGKVTPLLKELISQAGLSEVDDLIAWAARASKADIAALAPAVFSAWRRRQAVGLAVISDVIRRWGHDARACLRRLGKRGRVQFILSGGCFVNQVAFVRRLKAELRGVASRSEVVVAPGVGAEGAARLANERGRRIRPSTELSLIHI